MRKAIIHGATIATISLSIGTAVAEESCEVSGKPLPKATIETMLKKAGYTDIREIREHNGCYEAKGLDKTGKRFEVEIDSASGKISKAE